MEKFWAGGFLFNSKNNSVLLHKRDSKTKFNPDSWAFFGGLNEPGEQPLDCFIREMNEELSIDIKPNEVIPLCDYLNEELQTYRYVFYLLSDKQKSEFTLHEGADFDWVNLNNISNYKLTEKTERDLQTFLERKQFDITEGNLDDLDQIVQLNHEIFKDMYENEPYNLEQYQKRLAGKKPYILTVKKDGQLVGNSISFEQDGSFYLWIKGVSAECRGQGIGTQLLELEEQCAKEHGYETVTAKVYNVSPVMQELHKKRGYKICKKEKSPTDSKYDAVWFELKLTE